VPGGRVDRARREMRAERGTVPEPGSDERPQHGVALADRRLAELNGDSVILEEAAGMVERRAMVPATTLMLGEIRDTQRELFDRARRHAEESGNRRQIRLLMLEHLDQRARFMRRRLFPGFPIGDGLDFIAMCLAETLGRWGVLGRLATTEALAALSGEAQEAIRPQLSAAVEAAVGRRPDTG